LPSREIERQLIIQGYTSIAGLDEVGRGCIAGPVAAGVVIFPAYVDDSLLTEIRDSKKLSHKKRLDLREVIVRNALVAEVGWSSVVEIDEIGIVAATKLAMERAIEKSPVAPDYLLVDALEIKCGETPVRAIIRGDNISTTIAAASIVAKVTRDEYMVNLGQKFPSYHFDKNKGYGTKDHLMALRSSGPCDAHRTTFEPVASMDYHGRNHANL